MARNKDRVAGRIAAIKSASPVEIALPPQKDRKDRGAERRASYKLARLVLGGGQTITCVVKNMSKEGAKVVVEGSLTLPPNVTLEIDHAGKRLPATVAWQKDNEIGLSFTE